MRYGPAWERQRRYHSFGLWRRQAAPDGDRAEAGEIDAVEIGESAVNEVDAGLLAVADDVDPRVPPAGVVRQRARSASRRGSFRP
jgi:hypothetical protein